MTQDQALAAIKRKCKVLTEIFSDNDLVGFLDDHKTGNTYDIRRSIYDALTSAITVMEQSTSRGGISVTYADLFKIRRQFATAGVIHCARD